MSETFNINSDQMKKFKAWSKRHEAKYTGAIGGRYTFTFHPTTLGVVIKVIDEVTKQEIDLSDYEGW